jgi:hypothetical protein
MIRVELGQEADGAGLKAGKRHAVWEYRITSLGILGYSRQPLLDACRDVCAILGDTCQEEIGIYREGRDAPDLKCIVSVGARFTVTDDRLGTRFRKYQPFDVTVFKQSAE